MARSLSNTKFLSALVDGVSVSINRHGYATATQGVVASNVARSGVVKGGGVAGEEKANMKKEASETNCWAPDPVTGYYRPENCAAEMDVAELREMLLNHKTKQHSH